MQSLQSSGLPSIMSTDEFLTQVAWPGVQPSPSGGGGTSIAQELEAAEEQTSVEEDEPTPPEPFEFVTDSVVAKEEVPSLEPIPEPSLAHVPKDTMLAEDTQPSALVLEHEQLTIQDSSTAPVLDLNEDHPQEDQDI